MKKILILGGTGFIGLYLANELILDPTNQVTILARSSPPFLNQLHEKSRSFRVVNRDLSEINVQDKEILNVDIVYYLISASFPGKTWDNGSAEMDLNMQPFFIFFSVLEILDLRPKVVFLSSGGTVYGNAQMPDDRGYTEISQTLPYVPYGIFKLTQENLLSYYWKKAGIPYQIARVGNVYGPNFSDTKQFGVINIWLKQFLNNQNINIYGDGNIIRDYIFIKDLVKRLIFLAEYPETNQIFNLSTCHHISLNQLLDLMRIPYSNVNRLPNRFSDVEKVFLNGNKLEAICNLPVTKLEDGILETSNFEKAKIEKANLSNGKVLPH
jgi:UDP-glucose 4-epimerase